MASVYDPNDLTPAPTIRALDPNGRVFFHEGRVWRGIYPHRVEFIQGLFDSGAVDRLVASGTLIKTSIAHDVEIQGFGLVLEHPLLDAPVRPRHWSMATWLEAGRTFPRLLSALYEEGLALVDGTPHNFSPAPGGRVVWHDFGSIIPLPDDVWSSGLHQFVEYIYYPIAVYDRLKDPDIFRRLGYPLSAEQTRLLLGIAPPKESVLKPNDPFDLRSVAPERLIQVPLRRLGLSPDNKRSSRDQDLATLAQLSERMDAFSIHENSTYWGDYHVNQGERTPGEAQVQREKLVDRLLADAKPRTVLDIGANAGVYSHIALKHTERVYSVDYDETAICKSVVAMRARNTPDRVYPLVGDITTMSDESLQTFKSDAVLALALMHHLWLGQHYPWSHLAERLSTLTGSLLLVEHMPNGLGVTKPKPDPLPEAYHIDHLLTALRKHFSDVEIIPHESGELDHSPRTMIRASR